MTINTLITPAPSTSEDYFVGLIVDIVKPDGTIEKLGPHMSTNDGSTSISYVPTMTGTYSLILIYKGQTFGNITYLPSTSETLTLVAQQSTATPSPTETPSPAPTASPKTDVSGIINSDTTWTKEDSPYGVTGPVAVLTGVTLRIEAGTVVNLNDNYIQINGTLSVKGTTTEQVQFHGNGNIRFTPVANGYSDQTGAGCILENANLNSTTISSSTALKLNKVSVNQVYLNGGTATITGSYINGAIEGLADAATISNTTIRGISNSQHFGILIDAASATITNNHINGGTKLTRAESPRILNNQIEGGVTSPNGQMVNIGISVDCLSPTISNNVVVGTVKVQGRGGFPVVTNNTIEPTSTYIYNFIYPSWTNYYPGITLEANNAQALVANNIIAGCSWGIKVSSTGAIVIKENEITGSQKSAIELSSAANPSIQRNLITNNQIGINGGTAVIQNNTITNNAVGINNLTAQSTIKYNNLNNNQSNIFLSTPENVDATYNWWGTANLQAINQSIHDFKNDFNLGTVNFVPFSSAPNAQAEPDNTKPTINASSTPSPTQSPSDSSPTPNAPAESSAPPTLTPPTSTTEQQQSTVPTQTPEFIPAVTATPNPTRDLYLKKSSP